jgi:hypothetical protein
VKKKVRNNDEPIGSLLSFTSEKKKQRDDDESRGSLSSHATQEKPTSRFFFLGCRG